MTVRQRHRNIRDRLVMTLEETGPLSTRELMDVVLNMTTVNNNAKKLRYVPTMNELSNLLARDVRFQKLIVKTPAVWALSDFRRDNNVICNKV